VRDRQCSQWLVVVTTLIRRTDTVTATETKHNKKKPRLLIPISSANDGKEGKRQQKEDVIHGQKSYDRMNNCVTRGNEEEEEAVKKEEIN